MASMGVGPSHLGAFREGVYHLGHVRFRVFTLAHEKKIVAHGHLQRGCRCSGGFYFARGRLWTNLLVAAVFVCFCLSHSKTEPIISSRFKYLSRITHELLLRSPFHLVWCLVLSFQSRRCKSYDSYMMQNEQAPCDVAMNQSIVQDDRDS